MQIQAVDIAKSEPDRHGGYDLLVDLNQIGIPEDRSPPVEIHIEGERFFKAGLCEAAGGHYWSYWKDGTPAVNLQLHFS